MSGAGIEFKGFTAYPDGSGAPVTVDVYGDVYSFDFLGELKSHGIRIRPAHGNKARGMRDSGLKKAKRQYLDMVKKLGPEWLKKNLEMYPDGKGLKENMETLTEKAPPGWSGTVKAMKKHMPDEKAFALAWSMYKKGDEPHYKSTGGTTNEKKPELKKKYQEGLSGQLAGAMDEGWRGRRPTKEQQRTQWMQKFEDAAKKEKGHQPGKIDWNTATHLYNKGMTPEEAAKQMFGRQQESVPHGDLNALFEAMLEESVSLPAEIMAIPNFIVSKEGMVSESELMRKFQMTRTWAKKILVLAKRAFRGAGIPRSDMNRARANPGRYFREIVFPVLEKFHANKTEPKKGQAEDIDSLFINALAEELLTERGRHYYDGRDYYADTAFLNSVGGVMKGMELKHKGFGEFSLEGDGKTIEFDRTRGKKFPGQSGRSHKVYDNQGGKLVKELIGKMEKGDKSELVKEGIELDEAEKGKLPTEAELVAFMKEKPGRTMSVGELAYAFGLDSNVVSGFFKKLVKKGTLTQVTAAPGRKLVSRTASYKLAEEIDLTEAEWNDALDLCKKVTDGLPQLRKKHFYCRFSPQYKVPQVYVQYSDVPKGASTRDIANSPKQVMFVVEPFLKNGDSEGDLRVKVHYSASKDIGFKPMKGSVDEIAKHLVKFLKQHDGEKGMKLAASLASRLDAALYESSEDWTDLSVFPAEMLGSVVEGMELAEREDFRQAPGAVTKSTGGPPPTAATGELTSLDPGLRTDLERSVDQTRKFVRAVYHVEEVAAELAQAAQETERIRRTVGVERSMQRSPLGNAARSFEAEVQKIYGPFAEGRNVMMRVAKLAKISTRRTGKVKAPSVPTGEITATSLVRDVLQITAKLGATIRESAELGSVAIREAEKLLNQKSVIAGEKLQDRLTAFVQVYLDFRDQVSEGLFKMIAAVVRRMNEMTRRLMKMWESVDHDLYLISLPWQQDPDFEQTWKDEDVVILDEERYSQSIGWLEAVA